MMLGYLGMMVLGSVLAGLDAATFSALKTSATGAVGVSTILAGSVSDVGNVTLGWTVGEKYVANITVTVRNGIAMLSGKSISNGTLYAANFVASGTTVDTNLTLNIIDLALNRSEIKLTDGTTESNAAVLMIKAQCSAPPNGATPQCTNEGCTAMGESNDTSIAGKYKKCQDTYICGGDGIWTKSNTSCSELAICIEVGKWGDDCTSDCSAGCTVGGSVKTCFANGSCADSTYTGIALCMAGYSGDKCEQMASTDSSSASPTTSPTTAPTTVITTGGPTTPSVTEQASPSVEVTTTDAPMTDQCLTPPGENPTCDPPGNSITVSRNCVRKTGKNESCEVTWDCNENKKWILNNTQCLTYTCIVTGTWGPDCRNPCGNGCAVNRTIVCDVTDGGCIHPTTGDKFTECVEGYEGPRCDEPICEDCGEGICLAPNFCGNCPLHFEHGKTCRNIRLDGFLKGSLPSLAILAVVVIILSLLSKWHIRNKIKEA